MPPSPRANLRVQWSGNLSNPGQGMASSAGSPEQTRPPLKGLRRSPDVFPPLNFVKTSPRTCATFPPPQVCPCRASVCARVCVSWHNGVLVAVDMNVLTHVSPVPLIRQRVSGHEDVSDWPVSCLSVCLSLREHRACCIPRTTRRKTSPARSPVSPGNSGARHISPAQPPVRGPWRTQTHTRLRS